MLGTPFNSTVRGQFTGHETFPLRYGWLPKVAAVMASKDAETRKIAFDPDHGIATFGVGRNMVASMRHWSVAARIVELDDKEVPRLTAFGRAIFGKDGYDPYMENPATLWMLHWVIASTPASATSWYWAFNHHSSSTIDRDWLLADVTALCREHGWRRISAATLKRDVDCFFRCYAVPRDRHGLIKEDSLESPLSELELLVPGASKGTYLFRRGPKPSLPDGVFAYALAEFWSRWAESETLTLERVAYDPGSPGRVFKLDEESVSDRLSRLERLSGGAFVWSDTAGLRQVQRRRAAKPVEFLAEAYGRELVAA